MQKLKIAVVGLGRIGWGFHLPKITAHSDQFDLVGVVDLSEERLAEAKEKYGVRGYKDIASVVAAEHPDVITICSPTHLHPAHACEAMSLGCDVFLDKPMAVDYASAKQIADFAKESGRKLMVFQPCRAFAEPNQLMDIMASGKIGKVYAIQRGRCGYARRNDWQSLTKFGGGMLNNYGAHHIDELLYMTKEKVRRLNCIKYRIASAGDADDTVKITFETENNMLLDISIYQAAAIPTPTWLVLGQYGAVSYEIGADKKPVFRIRSYDPTAVPDITASDELAAANRSYNNDVPLPFVEEIVPVDASYAIDFYQKAYEYFAEDKAPFVPIEETLTVMDLIGKCHKDAEK